MIADRGFGEKLGSCLDLVDGYGCLALPLVWYLWASMKSVRHRSAPRITDGSNSNSRWGGWLEGGWIRVIETEELEGRKWGAAFA